LSNFPEFASLHFSVKEGEKAVSLRAGKEQNLMEKV
jgi:hypothetical protein